MKILFAFLVFFFGIFIFAGFLASSNAIKEIEKEKESVSVLLDEEVTIKRIDYINFRFLVEFGNGQRMWLRDTGEKAVVGDIWMVQPDEFKPYIKLRERK